VNSGQPACDDLKGLSVLFMRQSTEPSSDGDLVSEVGSEIKVTLDRWSAGQIGLSDFVVAGTIIALAALLAFVVRRLTRRWADKLEGSAATAGLVIGQLLSAAIYLVAVGLVLEVLGFGLGPVVMIVLVLAVGVMFLRPLISNMSSGLLLQLRSPFAPGDLVETQGITGVVEQVNTRTVILVTNDGRTAHIPSEDVLGHPLVNFSAIGRRRSTVTFQVPWGTDLSNVVAVAHDTVAQVVEVSEDPPPEVVISDFDGAHPCVKVLFWHGPEFATERRARDRVCHALVAALEGSDLALADPAIHVTTTAGSASGATD
jgi:small-conductance mechanosensitive channel